MLLSLLLLSCTSGTEPAASVVVDEGPVVPPAGFTLAYSGNLDGEIEPCG